MVVRSHDSDVLALWFLYKVTLGSFSGFASIRRPTDAPWEVQFIFTEKPVLISGEDAALIKKRYGDDFGTVLQITTHEVGK
jgi:hypothetical protein